METDRILELLTKALDDKKALDIKILDIREISDFADYFLICSANNPNQLKTLLETVEETLEKEQVDYKTEGRNHSGWILVDCNDFIVHIFTAIEREFYNIEHMWQDGNYIDIEKFLPRRDS